METIIHEFQFGFPDGDQVIRVTLRLVVAALLGAAVGIQREHTHKPAGLRTHMLVSLGAALFVLVPLESGMAMGDISRVIQGLATGIGFLGGGAILKLEGEQQIHGLTTAAGIWLTAALGLAAGMGRLAVASIGVVLTLIILTAIAKIEQRLRKPSKAK